MGEPDNSWMERLLRLTGPRPPVPEVTMARVRSAVHDHWRRELARRAGARRRRAGWLLAAAAVLAAGLALWRPWGSAAPVLAGQVERVVAEARLASGAPLAAGSELRTGEEIVTGASGRVALRLATGHSLRLDGGSALAILGDRAFTLARGALYVDSGGPAAASGRIEIRTGLGTFRDLGTQFEVRWIGEALHLKVREGSVRFGGSRGAVDVTRGRHLTVDAAGATRSDALPAGEDPWPWTSEIAPAFPIDGRPLRQFLSWIQRERGLELRYGDPGLADSAPAITLQGSIDGLTQTEALASVLATCGLRSRIEAGTLIVERAAPGEPQR